MISGTPRKKSVYAAARTRTGKNTGPRNVRRRAIAVAVIATVIDGQREHLQVQQEAVPDPRERRESTSPDRRTIAAPPPTRAC